MPPGYTPAEPILTAFQQAEHHFATEDYTSAKALLQTIILQDKYFTPALRQLGICELRLGNAQNAIRHLIKYCKHATDDAIARANLAQAYIVTNELTRARQQTTLALKISTSADLNFLAAEIEEHLNDVEKAIKLYRKGLAIEPNRISAQVALARAYKNSAQYNSASEILSAILENDPQNVVALTTFGLVCHAIGAYETAVEYLNRALTQAHRPDIYYNLGLSYQQLQVSESSLQCFQNALDLEPSHIEAKLQLAESLSSLGKFRAARAHYEEILREQPRHGRAAYLLTQITRFDAQNTALEKTLTQILKTSLDRDNQVLLNFALAKVFDDSKRYDAAFRHVERANKLRFKDAKHASAEYLKSLDNTYENIASTDVSNENNIDGGELTPIFIVGMPRSGTTLLEKFICGSEDIASCGELDYFGPALFRAQHRLAEFANSDIAEPLNADSLTVIKNAYLARAQYRSDGNQYFVDKTPDNFKFYTLLHQMFPNARFIHCKRHPLDTIVSIYFQLFEGLPYSYDLDAIVACYEKTEKRIAALKQNNAQWLTVHYESLVCDPNAMAECLSHFLNTAINPNPTTDNVAGPSINTMSRWQARQEIYQSSINRWENYLKYLKPQQSRLLTAES